MVVGFNPIMWAGKLWAIIKYSPRKLTRWLLSFHSRQGVPLLSNALRIVTHVQTWSFIENEALSGAFLFTVNTAFHLPAFMPGYGWGMLYGCHR